MDQAFWIGCVQDPVTNHMIPGIAASEKTWDKKDKFRYRIYDFV